MHRMFIGWRTLGLSAITFCVLSGGGGSAFAEAPNVTALAARAAATVERLHHNASKALVTAAQDRAFSAYFHEHDHAAREDVKSRIDQISLSVQERFQVEEMCLIDPQGAEISRIVGNEIAQDLATDEADAQFFAPGFDTEHRKVYLSPIYLSPDANKWVVAYVTPVLVDGKKKSILHYEHALTAYTSALMRQAKMQGGNIIVVTDTGHVIFDSQREIPIERMNAKEALGDYFNAFTLAGHDVDGLKDALGSGDTEGSGRVTGADAEYELAFRQVGRWTVIVWEAI